MSAFVVELVGQETTMGKSPSGRRSYQVTGTLDRALAYALVNAAAPVTHDGLIKQNVHIEEVGGGIWDGDVQYGIFEQGNVDDSSWSFDIGTTSQHISNALEHVSSYVASGTAPDHKGAIGVRKDGSGVTVEGVDVNVPVFSWEETHYVDYSVITTSYIQTLETLVATINDDTFRIWEKGELLLLGVSGSKRGEQPVGLTYRFASSRTKKNFQVGDITVTEKEGNHYLWVEYEPIEDSTAKALTNRPKAVHVERVYDYGDYTQLGIGDPWAT